MESADMQGANEVNRATGENNTGYVHLGRKAWTAYVSVLFSGSLIVAASVWLMLWSTGTLGTVGGFGIGLGVIRAIYQILVIRSADLYYDNNGIWYFSGILPWAKGVVGLTWRNTEEAMMVQSFFSWMFNSHTVLVTQRFTKRVEIGVSHIKNGDWVAGEINRVLEAKFPNSAHSFADRH